MDYGGGTCSAEIVWLLLFSSFEASAKHMENTGEVTFHILSQKDKMSWCELSILHLAWYTVGTRQTAAAIVSLLLGGGILLLSPVWLFVTPRTAARQALLPSTISQSWLKFMSIESVMLSNHLILCHPPSPFGFSLSQYQFLPVSQLLASGGQIIGASASTLVLPMNIQG